MNGIAYKDDTQVVELKVFKKYTEGIERVEFELEENKFKLKDLKKNKQIEGVKQASKLNVKARATVVLENGNRSYYLLFRTS